MDTFKLIAILPGRISGNGLLVNFEDLKNCRNVGPLCYLIQMKYVFREDTCPPTPDVFEPGLFVDQNDYQDTAYGMDFITWYNNSLVCHGKRMLLAADKAFNGPMKSIPLGIKIPGIHWQMKCTATPRIAEIAAGLVDTKSNLDTSAAARDDAYGYKKILDMIAEVKREIKREIILHFTAPGNG